MKTQIWIAICVYVLVAIVKKNRFNPKRASYSLLPNLERQCVLGKSLCIKCLQIPACRI